MNYITLVSAETLNQQLNNPNWTIIDCRFSLANPETGRHPLPNFRLLVKKLGLWGISNKSQVVVYDDASGAFAGRLWWLLRCLGHDSVAVLDGGISHWQKQGGSLTTTLPNSNPKVFRAYMNHSCSLTASEVTNRLANKSITLIDARTAERFRGEKEPIDPVAGHIPYAINRAFQLNLDEKGLFLSRDLLRQQFKNLIPIHDPEQTVHMCGSGVTACHNILAMEHAGLFGSKLYSGSWSEWIKNHNRSITTG
jgi:thiosulfate/3-mercaptopyruvate sulfurtransferase